MQPPQGANCTVRKVDHYNFLVSVDKELYNNAMGERKKSLSSVEVLSTAWGEFRAGNRAVCPACADSLALAVDSAGGGYRFVCAACGHASAWFESSQEGVRVRDFAPPVFDGDTLSDDDDFDDQR